MKTGLFCWALTKGHSCLTLSTETPQSATVVWTGSNPATEAVGSSLRLFKRTYDNPKPDLTIETLDFVSTQAESALFLVALTVEE
jgi:hypothetical protein